MIPKIPRHVVGQHFLIGVQGTSLLAEEKKFIVENQIAGVTLFARNLSSDPRQIYDLCAELHSLQKQFADRQPLLIGIDMEGGRVLRLKSPFTPWPALRRLGQRDSLDLSRRFAKAMGEELHAVGINLDYAPCADVFTNPENQVIGDRALSSDAHHVAKHVKTLIAGYLDAGVIPCAKHFPGHGDTLIDSHFDLPVEKTELSVLRQREFLPFVASIAASVPMIMTAHIRFDDVDREMPVTISQRWISEILRREMSYGGMIITDDLDMKALAAKFEPKSLPGLSLRAGCDLLLYCNEPGSPPAAIEAVFEELSRGDLRADQLELSYRRITDFKSRHLSNWRMPNWQEASHQIGSATHMSILDEINGSIVETNA